MCEIFALSARRPAATNDWLREFFADSPKHPHGWGLAWHRADGSLWLDKEPLPAHDSAYLDYLLRTPIITNWLIAHIRDASRGRVTYENCHPFHSKDARGITWVFAHNGTMLVEDDSIAAYGQSQRGTTDSERVLLYLLDQLDATPGGDGTRDFATTFDLLSHLSMKLSRGNKLNFVLSDGRCTFVHTNTIQHTLWCHHGNGTVLICTRPLADTAPDAWEPIPRCRLIAYRDGEVIAESRPHDALFDNDEYLRVLEQERRTCGATGTGALDSTMRPSPGMHQGRPQGR